MPGIFNQVNPIKGSLQTLNLAALLIAIYDLVTNPEAKLSEVGVHIVMHGITLLSLSENTSVVTEFLASSLNVFPVRSAIYAGVTSNCMSPVINAVDGMLHLLNAGTLSVSLNDHLDDEVPRPSR